MIGKLILEILILGKFIHLSHLLIIPLSFHCYIFFFFSMHANCNNIVGSDMYVIPALFHFSHRVSFVY